MKLSDLLNKATNTYRQYANIAGNPAEKAIGGLAGVLQSSINKSSPSFKAGTMNADGTPVAKPDMSNVPAAARTDLQGVDYYKNLAQNAVKPETKQAAIDWLDRQMGGYDSMPQTDTEQGAGGYNFGGGDNIDFSTPTSAVAYSAEKLNELFGTKSPEDLFAMREKLRRDAALAKAGLLPEEEYMQYQGLPGLQGERGYTYNDTMALNNATADIFSNAASKADQAIKDSGLNKSSGGISFGSIDPSYTAIINAASIGKTADERDRNRQDLAMAAQQGDDAFITMLMSKGEAGINDRGGEALKAFQQRATNAEQLSQFIASMKDSGVNMGNLSKLKQKAFKLFGAQSPEYAMALFLSGSVSAQERNRLFGASLTGTEKEDASQFIITDGDTNKIALDKARAMQATMTYANDIQALTASGVSRSQVSKWQNEGKIKTLDDYLTDFGSSLAKKSSQPRTQVINGVTYRVYPDGSAEVVSFNQVGGGTNTAIGNQSGKNRPQRNNNPLNIKSSSFTSKFPGVKGIDGKPAADGGHFLVFNSPQDGFNAAVKLFREGKSYQGKTVDQALRIWSNNGYGGNIVPQYANMPIQSLPNNVLQQIIQKMANAEGYYA